jgi:intracellular sulfur oxidation DsrE/DsrF family protein
MTRRSAMRKHWVGWLVAAGVGAGFLVFGVPAGEASHNADNPKKHKIVYHFNGSDDGKHVQKAKEVLGNIVNHVNGVGGWKNIEDLVLVTHGNGIEPFVEKTMDPEVRKRFEMLMTSGMKMGV